MLRKSVIALLLPIISLGCNFKFDLSPIRNKHVENLEITERVLVDFPREWSIVQRNIHVSDSVAIEVTARMLVNSDHVTFVASTVQFDDAISNEDFLRASLILLLNDSKLEIQCVINVVLDHEPANVVIMANKQTSSTIVQFSTYSGKTGYLFRCIGPNNTQTIELFNTCSKVVERVELLGE